MEPTVSVVIPTYQHAGYIEQCVRSVLDQRTSFKVEILIGEDDSTDGTRAICERLAKEHPERIRLFLNSRADVIHLMGRPTGRANFLRLLREARGKYIALCEGDDYWTHPDKLQMQVDLLDPDPSCSMCCHLAQGRKGTQLDERPVPPGVDLDNIHFEDLLSTYNFISTASVVFRNMLGELPEYCKKLPFLDLGLIGLLSAKGRIRCLPEKMCVYRISGDGGWSKLGLLDQYRSYARFYEVLYPHITDDQMVIVRKKYKENLLKMAKLKYPSFGPLRWLYGSYLQRKHRL